MPKKCIKSSYLANYYTNFIHFEMPGQIWTKMIEMAKICRNGCSAHIYTGCHKKGTNKTNKNGQTRQACQHCKVVQRGPKGSKMVNLDVLDHLGPFWARLDPFEQFQTKISFCSKAPPPNPTLSLWGNKLIFVWKGTEVSRWAQKSPKLSKTSRLTITDPLDPFGPLWNVDKPAMFGHFCLFYWCIFWGYPVYICAPLPFLRCYLHIRWYFFTWSDPLSQIFCLMNKKDLFCSAKNPIWHFWLSSILSTFQQLILNNISKTKS